MKIGIFGINSSSGVSFSKKKWKAKFKDILSTVIYADKIDIMILYCLFQVGLILVGQVRPI